MSDYTECFECKMEIRSDAYICPYCNEETNYTAPTPPPNTAGESITQTVQLILSASVVLGGAVALFKWDLHIFRFVLLSGTIVGISAWLILWKKRKSKQSPNFDDMSWIAFFWALAAIFISIVLVFTVEDIATDFLGITSKISFGIF